MLIQIAKYLEELRQLTNFLYLEGMLVICASCLAAAQTDANWIGVSLAGITSALGYLRAIKEEGGKHDRK